MNHCFVGNHNGISTFSIVVRVRTAFNIISLSKRRGVVYILLIHQCATLFLKSGIPVVEDGEYAKKRQSVSV